MGTYSFTNIQATLIGPDATYPLGAGSAVAEEGITIEMLEDKTDMKVGADGAIMHSLRASDAARITVRLQKTSPVNAQLSESYNFQKSSSLFWGQNIIKISDTVRGDIITAKNLAFARQPVVTYSKDAGMNEWQFLGEVPAELLGVGVPDVNI